MKTGKKLKRVADVVTYSLTITSAGVAILKYVMPGQPEDGTAQFILFSVMAAVPDLICLTASLWLLKVVIIPNSERLWQIWASPFHGSFKANWLKWVGGGITVLAAIGALVGTTKEGILYLRARGRFYVHLFRPAYEQTTERQHLLDSLSWQTDRALSSATKLIAMFPDRPDQAALRARIRGYKGFTKYCTHLNTIANASGETTSADHRLVVDYYCELLSLAPQNPTARERLKALRRTVLQQEDDVRTLYRLVKSGNNTQALSFFGKVKGYLLENTISNKLNGRLTPAHENRLAPDLVGYIRDFEDENAIVGSMRESWRIPLMDAVIKKSETCERVAALWPTKWNDIGRILMEYQLPAYSRALFNSLSGLRPLSAVEKKALIQSSSASGQYDAVLRLCGDYARSYPLDNEVRVALASANADKQKFEEVLQVLAPFGEIPADHVDAVFDLRIRALQGLEKFSSARVEALNWIQHSHSLDALLALGICESNDPAETRLESMIELLNAITKKTTSIDQSDDEVINKVETIISFIAEQIDAKSSTISPPQKMELAVIIQHAAFWLWLEMASRPALSARLVAAGHKLDPANAALRWMGLEEQLANENGEIAELREEVTPGGIDPPEYRYRIANARRELKLAASTSGSETESSGTAARKLGANSLPKDNDAWRRADVYEQPREEVFQFGYELYSAPSLQAQRIKSVSKKTSVVLAGEITVNNVTFYLSDWSLQRFQQGHGDGSYLKRNENPVEGSDSFTYPELKVLPKVEERAFPRGYQVFDGPSKSAALVKSNRAGSCAVAAYLDTTEGRFYLSDYSFERYQKQQRPLWWICEIH